MKEYNFAISLRKGLSIDAPLICNIGFADTLKDAVNKAIDFVNDNKNKDLLQIDQCYYVRQIIFKKNEAVGLDYGSYSRFVIVKKQCINYISSIWRINNNEKYAIQL